ncbi:MAG: hypothetical protein Ta2B_27150 [Termitinemataceae bacterium]|nr:MAG: hypothetical protein Ta2B_27150 [Termitinemataceae bacterium]
MNTGLSTFSAQPVARPCGDALPTYTVIGTKERIASTGLSAVLLNRGGGMYSKKACIADLCKQGFDYIVSVENFGEHYEAQQLSELFPFVSFILLKESVSTGQMINIAAGELNSPLFFVFWNDLHLLQGLTNARIAEKLLGTSEKDWSMRLCTVPVIQNAAFETLPTAISPSIIRKKLQTTPFSSEKEGDTTLFPYDCIGIYNRELFLSIGGFDTEIKSAHWQLMDFGMRSWLWGHTIKITQLVRLRFDGEFTAGDSTVDDGYWLFFLKNLAPSLRKDSVKSTAVAASVSWTYFFEYLLKSGQWIGAAYKKFSSIRRWVRANGKKYVHEACELQEILKGTSDTIILL